MRWNRGRPLCLHFCLSLCIALCQPFCPVAAMRGTEEREALSLWCALWLSGSQAMKLREVLYLIAVAVVMALLMACILAMLLIAVRSPT